VPAIADTLEFGLDGCDQFGLDNQGAPLTYSGEFADEPGWSGNVGAVELEPGSAFEDLIGTSATGPVNGDPVTIDMVAFRDAATLDRSAISTKLSVTWLGPFRRASSGCGQLMGCV